MGQKSISHFKIAISYVKHIAMDYKSSGTRWLFCFLLVVCIHLPFLGSKSPKGGRVYGALGAKFLKWENGCHTKKSMLAKIFAPPPPTPSSISHHGTFWGDLLQQATAAYVTPPLREMAYLSSDISRLLEGFEASNDIRDLAFVCLHVNVCDEVAGLRCGSQMRCIRPRRT